MIVPFPTTVSTAELRDLTPQTCRGGMHHDARWATRGMRGPVRRGPMVVQINQTAAVVVRDPGGRQGRPQVGRDLLVSDALDQRLGGGTIGRSSRSSDAEKGGSAGCV